MNRLSSGSRVTRHTQGLTKSLDAPQKLVVKELELTDFMYVSGPGIVLEEDQPVMFGQSMVPTGHSVQVAINKLDRTLSEVTEQLEAKVTDAETRLSDALTSSVPIDQVKVGLGQSLIPNGHSVQVAINKLDTTLGVTLDEVRTAMSSDIQTVQANLNVVTQILVGELAKLQQQMEEHESAPLEKLVIVSGDTRYDLSILEDALTVSKDGLKVVSFNFE